MNLNKLRTKFTVFVSILFCVVYASVAWKQWGGFLLAHTWLPAQHL